MVRYIRLGIKGKQGQSEVWSVNPVLDPYGEIPGDFDQVKFDAFTAAVGALTLPTNLKNAMGLSTTITSIRAELRDTTLEGFLGASEFTLPTPIAGGSTANKPAQTCVVISLRSSSALASGRGRMYWPATGLPIDATTLRLTSGVANGVVTDMKSYLTSIVNAAESVFAPLGSAQFGVSIYSPTKKILTPVTRLQVGDVLDTQRRRRDAFPETYQSVALGLP